MSGQQTLELCVLYVAEARAHDKTKDERDGIADALRGSQRVINSLRAERNEAQDEVLRLDAKLERYKGLGITKLSEDNARLQARCEAQVATIKRLRAEADVAQCALRGARYKVDAAQHEAGKAKRALEALKYSIRKVVDV